MINLFKNRKIVQPLIQPDLEDINAEMPTKQSKAIKREGPLKEQVFVFTGIFDSFERVDAELIVRK